MQWRKPRASIGSPIPIHSAQKQPENRFYLRVAPAVLAEPVLVAGVA
jgi:hypothetical protein